MAEKHLDSLESSTKQWRTFPKNLALILLAFLATPSFAAQENPALTPVQAIPQTNRFELEALVSRELQRAVLGKFRQIEGAKSEITIQAKFDLESGLLIIDMGSEYGPLSDSPALEDIQQRLDEVARTSLQNFIPYLGTSFRYGGKDYFHYHPEDWHPPQTQSSPGKRDQISNRSSTMVISAGHGYFKLYKGEAFSWVLQRSKINDLQEDFITTDYANELESWLTERNNTNVFLSRSISSKTHPSSAAAGFVMTSCPP
jgi:hypothetical protein